MSVPLSIRGRSLEGLLAAFWMGGLGWLFMALESKREWFVLFV
jgi:hypothetical protein